MKALVTLLFAGLLLPLSFSSSQAQIVISNKNVSLGTTGRIGAGFSPSVEGNVGRSLNLLGHGSLGGRLEQGDYIDLLPAVHFTPATDNGDTTSITFQARIGMYASGGQFLGNVSSRSTEGLTIGLPEAFIEAKNIMGSDWSVWAGARYMRYDDIHITDYFYFDDHSSEGFGVNYKNTSLTVLFPAVIDAGAIYPFYYYVNMVNGAPVQALRQRSVIIGEHLLNLPTLGTVKLLGEYHHMPGVTGDSVAHPTDKGWVLGTKSTIGIATAKPGSFNQLSVRYGNGIANGGENGLTQTWVTYGVPDPETKKFNGAYSLAVVEHFLLNVSNRFSLNGYGVFTKSKGGADIGAEPSDKPANVPFNSKTDVAVGFRSFVYLTDWLHLLNELHYTSRQDADQNAATMMKFTVAPTIAPTGSRDPWARPHIRFIFSAARYNKFAQDNLYSPFLQQAGSKAWGTYFGVRSEWWIF